MRRVVIVGNSGSGKTTLAAAVAQRIGVRHVELDALFHQADWQPTPTPAFCAAVSAALDAADADVGGWVVCGNYRAVRSLVWTRADTVVWIDLPRHVVMTRVIRRTAGRVVARTELWNGNRESLRNVLALHLPDRSIVRWTWDGVHRYHAVYEPMFADPAWAELRRFRLRSPAQVGAWLETVGSDPLASG